MPSISVSPYDASLAESSGYELFQVTLSQASPDDLYVDWQVNPGTIDPNPGVDVWGLTGTVFIPAGDTVGYFTVDTVDDNVFEADETFTVSLTNVANDSVGYSLDPTAAAGVIVNDDAPAATISVSSVFGAQSEADGFSEFQLHLDTPAPSDMTVDWKIVHTGPHPTDDADFNGVVSGSVFVAAGSTDVVFDIQVNDDTDVEANETFQVVITGVSDPTVAVDATPAASTIVDDDQGGITPFAQNDFAYTPVDHPVLIDITANDTDPQDGQLGGYSITGFSLDQNTHGQIALVNGLLEFTPDPGYSGLAVLTYGVQDSDGNIDNATVTIQVGGTPPPPPPGVVDFSTNTGTVQFDNDGDPNTPAVFANHVDITLDGQGGFINATDAAYNPLPGGDIQTVTGQSEASVGKIVGADGGGSLTQLVDHAFDYVGSDHTESFSIFASGARIDGGRLTSMTSSDSTKTARIISM